MNYYERHLGDYAKDTAHLTMLEHGAYSLLLDRYYSTEQGIPNDQAHRVARARTREEKQAVDSVLGEFFTLVDGVWINRRCDEEITKAQTKIKAAKENGKRGGRPKSNPAQTQNKPSGFSVGSENETQKKAHQTPDTSNQVITESVSNSVIVGDENQNPEPPHTQNLDRPVLINPEFAPNEHCQLIAKQHGLDIASERERFVAHFEAQGARRANWQSAFKKWLLDSMQFKADNAAKAGGTARTEKFNPHSVPPASAHTADAERNGEGLDMSPEARAARWEGII